MSKTIFCDIDGTLLEYQRDEGIDFKNPKVLPGVKEALFNWKKKGYILILTTGRKESLRKATEEQLFKAGIDYDYLIMGLTGAPRYLINDTKPDTVAENTAEAIMVKRNVGFNKRLIEL